MTVRELLNLLAKCNPDAHVLMDVAAEVPPPYRWHYPTYGEIDIVEEKETVKIVYLSEGRWRKPRDA